MVENQKNPGRKRSGPGGMALPDALTGKSVLIVEDEYLVGLDMVQTVAAWRMSVTGPISTLKEAEAASEADWDCAVLDVNLGQSETLDLARRLSARGVAVVFVTAYAGNDRRFSGDLAAIPRLGKPVPYATLRRLLLDAMRAS